MYEYGNQIALVTHGRYTEKIASEALKPGHFVEVVSTGKIQKQSVEGGSVPALIAIEDKLRGNRDIFAAYEADDVVPVIYALPGDVVQARIAAGADAIAKGDALVYDGTGCLKKASDPSYETHVVAIADEAVDNSEGEEEVLLPVRIA